MGKAAIVKRCSRPGDRSLNTEGEAELLRTSSLVQTGTIFKSSKSASFSRLIAVHTQVVYGDPHEVRALLGEHTAYVERTHLTARQMNGRLVRKSLSYSKQLRLLRAACSWEDWVYNLTRPLKTLRVERAVGSGQQRWQARTPAMAAGLTDHTWTIKELLTTVVIPCAINTQEGDHLFSYHVPIERSVRATFWGSSPYTRKGEQRWRFVC